MTATVAENPTQKRSFMGQELAHTHYWRSELPETTGKRSFSQLLKEEFDASGYWRTKKNIIGSPTTAASTVRTS